MLFLLPGLVAGATSVCTEGTYTNSLTAMGTVLSADDLARLAFQPPLWALGMSETMGSYSFGNELRAERRLCAPIDNVADGYELRVADEAGRSAMARPARSRCAAIR